MQTQMTIECEETEWRDCDRDKHTSTDTEEHMQAKITPECKGMEWRGGVPSSLGRNDKTTREQAIDYFKQRLSLIMRSWPLCPKCDTPMEFGAEVRWEDMEAVYTPRFICDCRDWS